MRYLLQLFIILCLVTSCKGDKTKNSSKEGKSLHKVLLDSISLDHIENIPEFTTGYKHKAMVLGTFHFNRASDGSDVVAKNHIDISTEENQELIKDLSSKIANEYQPTIIVVEWMPKYQSTIDSLYTVYKKTGELPKNEAFQIGFRVANQLNLPGVYCVDNRPPQPESIVNMELDFDEYLKSLNQESMVSEYDQDNNAYNNYMDHLLSESNVLEHLITLNSPKNIKRYKAFSFTGLVNAGYTDNYVGADFTGMWYQRNTRIYVNTRNLTKTKNERVLVIYGAAHKWALDEIFDGSPEFTLEQPFQYE